MAQDLDTQVNVKMPKRLLTTLREIEKHHGISPADALRRLAEEMAQYYTNHGWFGFPVKVEPRLPPLAAAKAPQAAAESLAERIQREMKSRLLPVPKDLNVWALDPDKEYMIDDDKIVAKLLEQLGLPNLFSHAAEHDQARFIYAFDNHPTHWLVIDFYKGSGRPGGDGLLFRADSKKTTTREAMITLLRAEAEEMESKDELQFSQIPPLKESAPPTVKHAASS